MNRIHEIIRLEGIAEKHQKASSAERWEAAKLIWEELQTKSFRELSAEITSAGGKGSVPHLQRMNKCWEFAIKNDLESASFSDMPNFTDQYQGPEVRGESDQQRKGRHRQDDQADDYSATGLVTAAANSIHALHTNKAYLPLLTEEDKRILREVYADFRALIHDIG